MPEKPRLFRPSGPTRKQQSESSEDRKADKRFYAGVRWRKLRKQFLAENPLCVCPECKETGRVEIATDVDHIIDRKERPDLSYEWQNLQPLAHGHHSRKTASKKR